MSLAHNTFFNDVRHGDLAAVKRALARSRAVLHARGADQRTALHIAAEVGNHLVLRTLLQQGADYAAADAAGEVPLMLAARQVRRVCQGHVDSAPLKPGCGPRTVKTRAHPAAATSPCSTKPAAAAAALRHVAARPRSAADELAKPPRATWPSCGS
jgi:hypothetical protein